MRRLGLRDAEKAVQETRTRLQRALRLIEPEFAAGRVEFRLPQMSFESPEASIIDRSAPSI